MAESHLSQSLEGTRRHNNVKEKVATQLKTGQKRLKRYWTSQHRMLRHGSVLTWQLLHQAPLHSYFPRRRTQRRTAWLPREIKGTTQATLLSLNTEWHVHGGRTKQTHFTKHTKLKFFGFFFLTLRVIEILVQRKNICRTSCEV